MILGREPLLGIDLLKKLQKSCNGQPFIPHLLLVNDLVVFLALNKMLSDALENNTNLLGSIPDFLEVVDGGDVGWVNVVAAFVVEEPHDLVFGAQDLLNPLCVNSVA